MRSPNYKKIFAMKSEREGRIKKICPDIPYSSGIYVFYRTDEANIRRAYCGQAVRLCERCAAHLSEYDHIALSLKKHGFYSEKNPNGWKLKFKICQKENLDEEEISTIKMLADKGFQLYNISSGGQSTGKVISDGYKQPKTYREGLEQGRKNLAKELSHIAEKHLTIEIRADKRGNKISERQYEKFMSLIKNCGDGE